MSSSSTLSLVILTHNSVQQLDKKIALYAKKVNEIIFIDNESEDDIQGLAKKIGATIISRKLENDFAAQRNAALEKVSSQWTLFLDADEEVPDALWKEIDIIIENDFYDAAVLPRRDVFLGRELKYGEVGQIALLRLARTKLGQGKWQRPVHETWNVPTNRATTTQSALLHFPHPSIHAFLQKLHWYASLEAQSRTPYGLRRIYFELMVFPIAKFIQNYFWRQGYKDGIPGFFHALCMSYYSLITRIYLYEAWHT